MFLRRSLASLARAYKLHVYDFFFMSVHLGACPTPPPPYTKKLAYATVARFCSPEEWPNEDGRFRPPHSLHDEIAATGMHTMKRIVAPLNKGAIYFQAPCSTIFFNYKDTNKLQRITTQNVRKKIVHAYIAV